MAGVIREGHCLQCGRCCDKVIIEFTGVITDSEDRRWLMLHEGFRLFEVEGVTYLEILAPCKKRSYDKDGLAVCAYHGTDLKPKNCVAYPWLPFLLEEGCGYSFRPEE